jgi:hypothetical protein
MDKIAADLVASDITIRRFSSQGHGEPLRHADLPLLARLFKGYCPGSYLSVAKETTACTPTDGWACGIDEFVSAVGGVDQVSNEPSRGGGDFEGVCLPTEHADTVREEAAHLRTGFG